MRDYFYMIVRTVCIKLVNISTWCVILVDKGDSNPKWSGTPLPVNAVYGDGFYFFLYR